MGDELDYVDLCYRSAMAGSDLDSTGFDILSSTWSFCFYVYDENLLMFFQISRLNASYPGGLASYIKTARELLADSKAGKNPYDGFSPSVS